MNDGKKNIRRKDLIETTHFDGKRLATKSQFGSKTKLQTGYIRSIMGDNPRERVRLNSYMLLLEDVESVLS